MSIQAGIETELPHLRAEEEARHVDLFRITRPDPDGRWEYNPATGRDEPVETFLFEAPGRVRTRTTTVVGQDVGARTAIRSTRELRIAVMFPGLRAGDIATCVDVDPDTSDPTLLGARLRVTGPAPGSQMTCRRYEVTEYAT